MRLFVKTDSNDREYLPQEVVTRFELASKLGGTSLEVNGRSYHVNDVRAVPVQFVMNAALIIGGLGASGVLLGTLFAVSAPFLCFILSFGGILTGIAVASKLQEREDRQAKIFNSSRIDYEGGIRLAQAA